MAQDTPDLIASTVSIAINRGGVSAASLHVRQTPCLQPPGTRVHRTNSGFPQLGPGRAIRVPPPIVSPSLPTAGRGSKQQAVQRQSGQQVGQGNPPVAKVTATAATQPGKTHVPAHAGRLPSVVVGHAKEPSLPNSSQQRSRWGDDGYSGYGEGHHRGGATARGGRGYAWQNNGAAVNGFNAPPWQFVPGPSGPSHPKRGGFRQNWIGRGGGRKPRPPVATPEQPADLNDSTVVTMTDTVKEVADSSMADQSLVSAKGDGAERPSKWARKKEKMMCYRCSETGHFVSECKAELCVYCLKPSHGAAKCPLTIGPLPFVTIYVVSSQELMFFESRAATATIHAPDAGFTGTVTVTRGC
ncbi:hypothetical protein ZWY2020_028060 [Hordeum vulgare]|nr:hypothetical protein ZWY2020_028060 [Hordeum vulgare]